MGAWGFESQLQNGLFVNEAEFLAEVIDPATGEETNDGELVITNLGRPGFPVIRYRTGDHVVVASEPSEDGRTFMRFEGGVTGRVDDVLIVRGVNIFPSAVENLVRRYPEIGEFAVDVYRKEELDVMELRIEVTSGDPDAPGNRCCPRDPHGDRGASAGDAGPDGDASPLRPQGAPLHRPPQGPPVREVAAGSVKLTPIAMHIFRDLSNLPFARGRQPSR